jgi:hypothetical protein
MYTDGTVLANITIAGWKGHKGWKSAKLAMKGDSNRHGSSNKVMKVRHGDNGKGSGEEDWKYKQAGDNVHFVEGLEDCFTEGAWDRDFVVRFT